MGKIYQGYQMCYPKELQTDETQKLYIYENQSTYMKFKQDSYVLRGLSIIVVGVLIIFSLAIVKNINRQYLYNHREDINLLYYLGLSKTQIKRIYLFQSLFSYFCFSFSKCYHYAG